MKRIGVCVLLGLLSVALSGNLAWAQSTGQINGTVKDQTGAVLPGVEITATQTATGGKRNAISNESGAFVLASLPIGPYMVEASLPGFKTFVQSGIVLQVNANPSINVILEVGQVSDQIEVQANASLVETQSSGVGTVIDNQRVVELPLNGRNATELIFLAGMANVGGANGGFLNSVRNYPTVMISVTGGVANWTTYNFDGTSHNDAYNSLNLPLPFPDALQEFKVESSALPAQYGVHASAQVNVVTKSGTNEFHGDAFEFVRNGIFNARNFFAAKRDTLKRNQFGGVIGGPIIKNKLFFFGGYQGTLQRSEPATNTAYVPTAAMLAGDFTAVTSPACAGGRQLTLTPSQGFVNNMISPTRFNPAALNIVKRLPLSTDPCGKVSYGLKSNSTEHMEVARIDWNKSEKHSMFSRFFVTDLEIPTTYDGVNALTLNSNKQDDRVYAFSIGDTYLFGAGLVSSFRAGVNRSEIPKIVDNFATWAELGVNAPYNPAPSPRIAVQGNGFNIGSGNSIINSDVGGPNPSFSEDISWVKGNHQLGFGGAFYYTILNYKSGINATGLATFNGTTTTLPMADFLLGQASTWAQGNVQSYLYNRQKYIGSYLQDSWRATPRLTVNYGVRWEPYFSFVNKHGWFDHFDPTLFSQNVKSQVYVNGPAGLVFPGDSQWTPGGKRIAKDRWNILLPRLGLVWDPMGNGKLSIRASAGVFTDRGALYSMSAMAQNSPFGSVVSIPNANLSDPWATYPGGNPLPFQLTKDIKFPTFASYVTDNLEWKPTYVNQFNLSIQKQFGENWLVTANYVGNTTSHLITAGQINPAIFLGTGPCTIQGPNGPINYTVCSTTANTNQRRRFYLQNPVEGQYYGIVSTTDDGGTGSYNGMFLQLTKRLSGGTTLLANYTWSHCISDLWNGNPGNNGVSAVTPLNRRADRGNCDPSDQRHVFNANAVMQVPKFANRTLSMIASDWQFSPILKIKSGTYFTASIGTDQALNGEGVGNQRPNLKPGVSPYAANQSVDGWLNRDAFEIPALGSLGTLGRNNLLGPGQIQVDLAVSRTFKIPSKEGQTIQVRAEAFNLPNHLNPGNPVSALNSGAFGQIQSDISGTSGLSSGNSRIMQFALKYVF